MWVYVQTEKTLWTTGFYDPKGFWYPDRDYASREEAAQRVHYLNGGNKGNDGEDKKDESEDKVK